MPICTKPIPLVKKVWKSSLTLGAPRDLQSRNFALSTTTEDYALRFFFDLSFAGCIDAILQAANFGRLAPDQDDVFRVDRST